MSQKKRIFFAILDYCLVIFAVLNFVLGFVVLPHVIFGWHYPLPEFVSYWEWWLKNYLELDGFLLSFCFVGTFFGLAVVLSWLSRSIADRLQPNEVSEGHSVSLDKVHDIMDIDSPDNPEIPMPVTHREELSYSLIILVLIAVVILSIIAIEILVSTF